MNADPVMRSTLACACRCLPIRSGVGTISVALNKRFACLSREIEVPCTLRGGLRIRSRRNDYNGRMLFLFGTPDPMIVTICYTLLREGDVFLDIGANYGSVGLPELLTHPGLRFILFDAHCPEVKALVGGKMNEGTHALLGIKKNIFSTRLFPLRNEDDLKATHDVLAVRVRPEAKVSSSMSAAGIRSLMVN